MKLGEFGFTLENVRTFFKGEDVADDIKQHLIKALGLEKIGLTFDNVKEYLGKTDDGKRYLALLKDKAVAQAVEEFEAKKMPLLLKERYDKEHPPETPEQKRLIEMEAKLEKMEAKDLKNTMTATALEFASNNEIPVDIAKLCVGETEEITNNNLNNIKVAIQGAIDTKVTTLFKDKGIDPAKQIKKAATVVNPWKKETLNVTDQMKIQREDSALANKLKQEAGIIEP